MSDRIDFTLAAADGTNLCCYEWPAENARAAVVILHGMAEHAARYGRFAAALNGAGIAAVAMDLRGHGKTAASGTKGWFAEKDGWRLVLEDIRQLSLWAREKYAGRPLVLFGHSMGSVFAGVAQSVYGEMYRASVLSGVNADIPVRRNVAPYIAKIISALQGRRNPSPMLDNLTFGSYNRRFKPARTKFDWLSRDVAEVDKFLSDENCGFISTGAMFADVSRALLESLKKTNISRIPKSLPVFIVSGAEDPAGMNGRAAAFFEKRYRAAGLDVTAKVYEKTRHEPLNETNRDEVTADILGFIDKHIL
jgi:alpha-beta hydrolase superfamily lysophospholipase